MRLVLEIGFENFVDQDEESPTRTRYRDSMATTGVSWRERTQALIWGLFCLHLVAQLFYALIAKEQPVLATWFVVLSFFSFSFFHLCFQRGWKLAGLLLLLCALVCCGLEALSLASGWPFGRYTYSSSLGPSIFGVPLIIALTWFMMAYPVASLSSLSVPRGLFVPFAAIAMTAWDLFLDPQLVRHGMWIWLEPNAINYMGIPLQNYFGWLITSTLLFALFAPFWQARLPVRQTSSMRIFDLLPTYAYIWTWLGSSLVNALWWNEPLIAVVGFLGMGVFALTGLKAIYARNKRQNSPEQFKTEQSRAEQSRAEQRNPNRSSPDRSPRQSAQHRNEQ